MSLSYRIDESACAVEIVFASQPTLSEMVQTLEEILADPAYHAGFDLISIRGDIEPPDAAYIRAITAHMRTLVARGLKPYRWASVVTRPAQYGMSRMAQSLLEPADIGSGIFSTLEEARAWLAAGRRQRAQTSA